MKHFFLISAMLFALTGAANATSYYVSDCGTGASGTCVAGNDANTGTSPTAPWKTCAKVTARFSALAAGDQVLFARGSAQNACTLQFLANPNSRAANPIVIGAYTPSWASASTPVPILHGTPSAYTLNLANSGNATHDEGYVVQDLHFVGTGTTSLLPAMIITSDVDYVTIQRVEIEEHRHGIQCRGGTSSPLATGSDGLTEHIVIRNSNIHHNRGMGLLLSCNDSLIENNKFDNNGSGMPDHHIYLDDAALNNIALPTKQVVIRGNTLTNNSPYASTTAALPTPGGCRAVAIVVHGLKDGITIENNTIAEPVVPTSACWGISVDSGGYTGIYAKEGFTNVVIRGNTVINYTMAIGVDLCDRCTVENNYVYSEHVGAVGVIAPSKYTTAAIAGNTVNNRLTVRNNTIYLKNPNSSSVGIRVSRDGANHAVVSNLIYFGVGTGSTTSCFYTSDLPTSAFAAFDYNLCHYVGTTGKWEAARGTLAAQQSAGLDSHSRMANPNVVAPQAPLFGFAVAVDSVAIKAGHPSLSSEFGIGGVKRNLTSDIGAHQQGATVIVPSSPTGMSVR
jgi:hypothetical protein